MSDLDKAKERANLPKQKEAARRRRFMTNLFEGKLLKKQQPLVNGYSGPVGTNG